MLVVLSLMFTPTQKSCPPVIKCESERTTECPIPPIVPTLGDTHRTGSVGFKSLCYPKDIFHLHYWAADVDCTWPGRNILDMIEVPYHEHVPGLLDSSYLENGNYEVSSMAWMSAMWDTRPKGFDHFMDVGMNYGYFTMVMAKRGATVTAFEPQEVCHRVIEGMLQLTDVDISRVTTHIAGLGHIDTTIRTQVPRLKPICNPGNQIVKLNGAIQDRRVRIVPIVTPKSIWENRVPNTFVVKIDTEGAELSVLLGLSPFLKSGTIRHIVVEIAPAWWIRYNDSWTPQTGADILTSLAIGGRKWIAMADRHALNGLGVIYQANGHNNPLNLSCKPTPRWSGRLSDVLNWTAQAMQRAELKIGGIYWLTAPTVI